MSVTVRQEELDELRQLLLEIRETLRVAREDVARASRDLDWACMTDTERMAPDRVERRVREMAKQREDGELTELRRQLADAVESQQVLGTLMAEQKLRAEQAEKALAETREQLVAAVELNQIREEQLRGELKRVADMTAEMDAIRYAAHMPDDYQYGLPSWINQKLYVRLLQVTDKDGGPIRRTEDIERMRRQQQEIATLRASLGRAVGALKAIGLRLDAGQVLTCSYDIQQELAVLSDSPDANLRASLGRAVEALNKLYTVWQHSYSSYSERLDAEIKPVLSDPIGQRANAEWAAMRDALQFYASPYTWAAPFGRVPPNQYSPAELDMGEKAKAALQFEKGGEG